MTVSKASASVKELYQKACDARLRSHSPYSGHKVGAALRTASGEIFAGCNVENSSYGATNCAERVAIQTAVATTGSLEIREVMVVTDSSEPWPPCGLCRQVIAEFGPACTVYAANLEGTLVTSAFSELLPRAFTGSFLKK